MFRLAILFISLIWASLLLISWSGATTAPDLAPQTSVSSSAHS